MFHSKFLASGFQPLLLYFLKPIISLLTRNIVKWRKPTRWVVRCIQISSAPVHSWYCCFAAHEFMSFLLLLFKCWEGKKNPTKNQTSYIQPVCHNRTPAHCLWYHRCSYCPISCCRKGSVMWMLQSSFLPEWLPLRTPYLSLYYWVAWLGLNYLL